MIASRLENQAKTMPSTYQVIRKRGLTQKPGKKMLMDYTVITEQIGEPDLLEQCRAAVLRMLARPVSSTTWNEDAWGNRRYHGLLSLLPPGDLGHHDRK